MIVWVIDLYHSTVGGDEINSTLVSQNIVQHMLHSNTSEVIQYIHFIGPLDCIHPWTPYTFMSHLMESICKVAWLSGT